MRFLAIVLILVGILMITTGGFSFKTKEEVINTAVVTINRAVNKTVSWP